MIAIINNILVSGKLKIIRKREGCSELWTSLAEQVSALRLLKRLLIQEELLPEAIHPQWENNLLNRGRFYRVHCFKC